MLRRARRHPVWAAVIGLFVLYGASPAPVPLVSEASAQQPQIAYRLGPGDEVRVNVFGHDDLSGEFELDGAGRVSLPLIGTVSLSGLTLAEAENAIVRKLMPDYLKNPQVGLEVLNYRPFYIIGEVRNPGSYQYVNGITVLNAVAIAGGFTYRAREDTVYLKRGGAADDEKTRVGIETRLLPGDLVEVRERYF